MWDLVFHTSYLQENYIVPKKFGRLPTIPAMDAIHLPNDNRRQAPTFGPVVQHIASELFEGVKTFFFHAWLGLNDCHY